MKKLILNAMLLLSGVMTAQAQFASAPAFPGAEGYARYTTGGRTGTVYHVTTLEDDAANPREGMLRYYIQKKKGPRIIVFDVAGTIELQDMLKINKGDISILGQTAPGEGITLKNYTLVIGADNVIIRFLRCRMGDSVDADAMSASHHDLDKLGNDGTRKNIIIDHCSMSWSTDEVGSFYGNKDFTLQWCILSESLRANAAKGTLHGYGGIWGGERASFHHNLMANNDSRMPRLDHGFVSSLAGPVDCVNNVIYNWGNNSAYGGENNEGADAKKFNFINNYYKPGPATLQKSRSRLLNPTTACSRCTGDAVPGTFYLNGNVMEGSSEVTEDNYCQTAIKLDKNSPLTYEEWKEKCTSATKFVTDVEYFQYPLISQQKADIAFDKVVDFAGSSLVRDEIDVRVAKETKAGTSSLVGSNGSEGGLIDAAEDAGGWPELKGKLKKDTDGDGIPDAWEKKFGLDPNVDDASRFTLDERKYYSNLEVYANHIVEHIIKAQRAEAGETFEEYYPELKPSKK